ncbi:MBL fold metallo-hydrolase [Congregibacter litoralis]|uniref:Zn-dependent hydrolase n=1 Tax=Congregibacter litoralis KT71 TaxID=314285 RepID=A4AB69_9GAMM|nr:MBL fold metallo-hydrolase [Congregibacter litoralis]EAQ96623.1 Zn-dependent hydrolase [Congregibacter litoralis KT71]
MTWFLRISIALILLAVAAFGIFLGPAHLQIRGIEPTLPSEAELRALATTGRGPVSIRVAQSSSQTGPDRNLSHAVVIIEWPDGRRFMIDAAMDREASEEFGALIGKLSPGMGPVVFKGSAADLLGDEIATVDGVGFTHLHVDHVQGVTAFCAARGTGARSYQTFAQATEHNLHTEDSARQLEDSCLEPVVLPGEGLLTHSDFPGLGIVPLGGHTPGSTLFAVSIDGTLWLMSGDIANVKSKLLHNSGKGWVYSTLFVPENTARTESLRLWLSALDEKPDIEVIVAHDFDAALDSGLRPL